MSNEELSIKDRFWYVTVHTYIRKMGDHYKRMEDEDYLVIKELFENSKGSWVGLAEGSLDQWQLMRKVCKSFLKLKKERKERPFIDPKVNDDDEDNEDNEEEDNE